MKRLETIFTFCLLLCSLFFVPVGYCYEITEQELTQLENNLKQLEGINLRSQQSLIKLQSKLEISEKKSAQLEIRLQSLQETSAQQEKLLETVNQSFEQFEAENKKKLQKTKMQRTIWQIIAAGILVYAVERRL